MEAPARRQDENTAEAPPEPAAIVSSHEPRPGKLVFTERNNTDGWIATDLTVDLEP
ncbi:hypothetical protein [Salinadaptatus halalkaliphilus]|uniref:hypothetical protein n=1 Tax=Salinadaptatus halalkaliphilus TaxID=2419781 RepID=UPI0015811875|nr:hypothetical protein [Salinadaptatus halalkaliphilus]